MGGFRSGNQPRNVAISQLAVEDNQPCNDLRFITTNAYIRVHIEGDEERNSDSQGYSAYQFCIPVEEEGVVIKSLIKFSVRKVCVLLLVVRRN